MDNHIQAEKDYVKGMKYKEIAEKYGVSINTVKSWKTRHNWDRKKGAHKEKSVHTKKQGAPKGNINAKGNQGGGAPSKNKNAEKHGFFSKYLPEETLDLIQSIETRSPLDLLWDQIMIQYAAIMRSQQIMYVKDRDDLTKVLKREKESDGVTSSSWENEYELQFAWDKQANFLKAQSRAMGELRSMIKQYDELLVTEMATEEQRLRVEKLRLQTQILANNIGKPDETGVKIIDDIGGEE